MILLPRRCAAYMISYHARPTLFTKFTIKAIEFFGRLWQDVRIATTILIC